MRVPLSHTRRRRYLAGGVLAVLAAAPLVAPGVASGANDASAVKQQVDGGRARNVILFIGDGMGDSEITIARNYAKGANGRLAMDSLPMTGEYTTYSVDKETGKPDYVTDSAASGTGWATGSKTYNNAVSVDRFDNDLPTILEEAQQRGYVTGDVTTAELTDATPAVVGSHVAYRSCQGPQDMAQCPQDAKSAGGPGSIAEQLLDHGIDVLLGGGAQRFEQTVKGGPYAGATVLDQADAQGYTLVTDDKGLKQTKANQKVLGLFSKGTMPTRWDGPQAEAYTGEEAPNTTGDGHECQSNAKLPADQPSLTEMTTRAISLLDAKAQSGKGQAKGKPGFFLQVEGASIDKQDHAANPCAQIGETIDFDNAIKVGLQYQKSHPDTLIVVTADHGHTSQIVEYPQTEKHHTPGRFQTLLTKDGSQMVVNYATVADGSQDHTGTEVRIAAKGPQAFRVLGITNQTDLFTTFEYALGLK
ncbi:MAG: alkaline phosphatase [Actinomycetes bacterium]